MEFNRFGKRLVISKVLKGKKLSPLDSVLFVNPVSCVRYFEFSFADNIVERQEKIKRRRHALDISSPRIWPLWLGEKRNVYVTMVNPDRHDLANSKKIARYIKYYDRITFKDDADATALPFSNHSFDIITSISVIEHINGDGDTRMMSEIARLIVPGGIAIITFPVRPEHTNEYRKDDPYGTQEFVQGKGVFFQRLYDFESIQNRILCQDSLKEISRQYYVENPPGWFRGYEQRWIRQGLSWVVNDPIFMTKHFFEAGAAHPTDRMGICCLALERQ